ncbi:MAG: HAMP domain-containing histidine kinase, partial [Gemmatimonadales bacterium]|nr:HAMP domain-containing histidine kinase [Gemmatimonadales bacterium]
RSLVIVSIQDMADENRRKVLERTFFHDVMNAAGGAMGIANMLAEADSMDEVKEFAPLLVFVTEQLVAEIDSQRDMLAAERGELNVQKEDFGTVQLLMEVLGTYANHPVAEERRLELDPVASDHLIHTSKTLLHRVLGNMVKNALEATATGGTVRLGCNHIIGEFCFWVNNPEVMSQATQLQVFNRSFSTKGAGRGIGTYSIRLLGERYLGGRVSFDSTETEGTTFRIHLPAAPRDK